MIIEASSGRCAVFAAVADEDAGHKLASGQFAVVLVKMDQLSFALYTLLP
jgi:hypothetical protein